MGKKSRIPKGLAQQQARRRTLAERAPRTPASPQAPPDLAALEARVRDLDAAITAEDDAIAYHEACIAEHEAKQERLGDDLYEAVLRLAAASSATAEGRRAALDRITATLTHDHVLVEKPLDFDHPARWRSWGEREREAWHEALGGSGASPAAGVAD